MISYHWFSKMFSWPLKWFFISIIGTYIIFYTVYHQISCLFSSFLFALVKLSSNLWYFFLQPIQFFSFYERVVLVCEDLGSDWWRGSIFLLVVRCGSRVFLLINLCLVPCVDFFSVWFLRDIFGNILIDGPRFLETDPFSIFEERLSWWTLLFPLFPLQRIEILIFQRLPSFLNITGWYKIGFIRIAGILF